MKVIYEEKVDVVTIRFLPEGTRVESHLVDDEIVIDLAEDGRLAAIEIIGASERVDVQQLKKLVFEVHHWKPVMVVSTPPPREP